MVARPLAVVAPWRWWVGFGVIVVIAAGMSFVSYVEGLPSVFGEGQNDKILHFVLAGLLSFFLDGALARRSVPRLGTLAIPLAAVLVLVPVGLEEYLQRYATLRTSSIWDFVADIGGVACFIPLSRRAAK